MRLINSPTIPVSPWQRPTKEFSAYFQKAEEALQELIVFLAGKTDIEKVICFARRIGCNTSISSFDPEKFDAQAHYFLLVVTGSIERQEHVLQDYVNVHFKLGKVTLLAHGKETVEKALKNGSHFFTSVFRDGRVLYSRDGLLETRFLPDLDPDMLVQKAAECVEYNYKLAQGFHQASGHSLDNDNNTISLFLLHQAMEQAYTTLIRVFMGYRADMHNLSRLQDICLCFSEEDMLFPRQRPEENRLFQLLQKSYSGARYKQDFEVNEDDVQMIYNEVGAFLKRVYVMCEGKIEELAGL